MLIGRKNPGIVLAGRTFPRKIVSDKRKRAQFAGALFVCLEIRAGRPRRQFDAAVVPRVGFRNGGMNRRFRCRFPETISTYIVGAGKSVLYNFLKHPGYFCRGAFAESRADVGVGPYNSVSCPINQYDIPITANLFRRENLRHPAGG